MRITVLLPAVVCLAVAVQTPGGNRAMAQGPSPTPGTRVRVTAPSALSPRQQEGRLIALRHDSLVMEPDGGSAVAIPRSAVRRIDVSLGRHSESGRGVLVGLFGGAVAGSGVAAAFWSQGSCTYHPAVLFLPAYTSDCVSRGARAAEGGILGAVAGLVAGGLIGHAHQSERWQRVGGFAASALRLVPDRITVVPATSGIAFSLRI